MYVYTHMCKLNVRVNTEQVLGRRTTTDTRGVPTTLALNGQRNMTK